MSRRPHRTDAASNYWPGFVDALTNVVLNLLFLVAIFAMGVFVLGMEAGRHRALPEIYKKAITATTDEAPLAEPLKRFELVLPHIPTKQIAAQTIPNPKPSPSSPEPSVPGQDKPQDSMLVMHIAPPPIAQLPESTVTLDKTQESAKGLWLVINFTADALFIPSSSEEKMIETLRPNLAKHTSGTVRIWAVGGTHNPELRRAAYLRVVAVRNLLIKQGVDPKRLDLRLIDGESTQKSGQSVYVLVGQRTEDR